MANFPTTEADDINGNGGPNNINALAGDDQVDGRGGNDTLRGSSGDDTLEGGGGADLLLGGGGDDALRGQNGNDTLKGGGGNDSLSGGKGDDSLEGGSGADQFSFNVNDFSAAGNDTVSDFEDGIDVINLGDFGSFADLDTNGDGRLNNQDDFVDKDGNTTIIDVGAAFGVGGGDQTLTVVSSSNSALRADDFEFLA